MYHTRRSFSIHVVMATCLVIALAISPLSAVAQTVSQVTSRGVMVRLKTHGSDPQCLQPSGGSANSGSRYALAQCGTADIQLFVPVATGTDTYAFRNVATNLCIDMPANSTVVQQFACHGGPNQSYLLVTPRGLTTNAQWSRAHGLLLKNSYTNGHVGDDGRSISQTMDAYALDFDLEVMRFATSRPRTVGSVASTWYQSGVVPLLAPFDQAKCMDAYDARSASPASRPLAPTNATVLGSITCDRGVNQRWEFETTGNGELEIHLPGAGMCLDLPPVSAPIRAQVFGCHQGTNQRFRARFFGRDRLDIRSMSGACVGMNRHAAETMVTAGDCDTYFSLWTLGSDFGPPALRGPAPGAKVSGIPTLSWASVPAARGYVICIARPGIACPTYFTPNRLYLWEPLYSDSNVMILGSPGNAKNLEVEARLWGDGSVRDFRWTVGSCLGESYSECIYQQEMRSIHVVPKWRVKVAVASLNVLDSCDRNGTGEWRMALAMTSAGREGREAAYSFFSANSVRVYHYGIQTGVALEDVNPANSVTIAIAGEECDADPVGSTQQQLFSAVSPGLAGALLGALKPCSGEQPDENGGGNDGLGVVQLVVPPARWIQAAERSCVFGVCTGGPVPTTLTAPANQGCSAGPAYRVSVEVWGERY